MKEQVPSLEIRAIIGLGNPGKKYYNQRHNIGFRIVDLLAQRYQAAWQERDEMENAEILVNGKRVFLIKPLTFMNSSGRVIPFLAKKGIGPDQILVVHDELEKPFGSLAIKVGGSARGHNGLRSIIAACGPDFARLRFGIGRPEKKEQVADYVLSNFSEDPVQLEQYIQEAADLVEQQLLV